MTAKLAKEKPVKWEGEKKKNVLCTWVYWDGFNSDHLHTL